MRRWCPDASQEVENARIDAFLAEIEAVCRKHKLSISHEDGHGAFEIEDFDESNLRWLNVAHDRTTVRRPRYLVVEPAPPDSFGRQHFTVFWFAPRGVYHPQASSFDGDPVGYRRAQHFHAKLADHVRSEDVVCDEATAIAALRKLHDEHKAKG